MGVNLVKGQKVDLTKGNASLKTLVVGLGWDGSNGGDTIDCDASALMLGENGKLANSKSIIYFGNKKSKCKSVVHQGDNLDGAGSGDDEQIVVDLTKVPDDIDKIVFVVNIYNCASKGQHFGMIKNAYIRIVDNSANNELVKFNLSNDYNNMTSLIMGEVYRNNGEWKFTATGEGATATSITELSKRYI
ncbi:TerD family protein [Clostridium estertheticum]|uniref:TerD family protein n=1 Tax=Clostridium estertheticum TaxID=238834 RepID=UPI001C7D13E0|nr:TerD family protein [Clostridium estertheticum]MBX4261826.1 TerD family protein [Clostridium estertheticum]WLC71250.1 TerD family protein [Clostridium estertheticum]